MKVWIGGSVVEGDEARLPVTDHGLLYGDGLFEGDTHEIGPFTAEDYDRDLVWGDGYFMTWPEASGR